MLKKFPCLGDSTNGNLTDGAPKIHVVKKGAIAKSGRRLTPPYEQQQSLSTYPQAFASYFEGGTESGSSNNSDNNHNSCERRFLWRRFKAWFRGTCLCAEEKQGCNAKLVVWRSFRKDVFGNVPVAMRSPDAHQINSTRCATPISQEKGHVPQDSVAPPPYSLGLYNDYALSGGIYEESRVHSLETNGSKQEFGATRETPWCKILYWEGNERRGNVYPVLDPAINVLGDTPHGTGLSLAAFFGAPPRDERIRKTRRKICQGLVLWREGKVVWVYNRSEAPVYLNSASLDGSFFNLNLYKCPPGYAMIIYYYEMAHALMGLPDYKNKCLDKADVNSVRISFAKGWGKNYHRREILCCPCWIEVHVVPTLKVEQLTPPR